MNKQKRSESNNICITVKKNNKNELQGFFAKSTFNENYVYISKLLNFRILLLFVRVRVFIYLCLCVSKG